MNSSTRLALVFIPFVPLLSLRVDACSEPPTEYCAVEPIPAPAVPGILGGGLDGFDSPYLGHTGSWDGKGGGIGGSSKENDLDLEVSMGLRWTFMPVYWNKLEPDGPVDLSSSIPEAWQELDQFVGMAQARGLNILLQAPVVGGNAGDPPAWAGVREAGKSAPADMDAAAHFAAKLAERYKPDGTLARQKGWGNTYGIRAWELDNEPSSYKTHWDAQAGDYAEFVTKVSARIKAADPLAVILTPAESGGGDSNPWVDQALDAFGMHGSPTYQNNGVPYSIGPSTDVVSFHVYEGLDHTSIDCAFSLMRDNFEAWEGVRGFEYARKLEYWHTEGNYDFTGNTEVTLRANWRWQFMSRAFAAGIRKVMVMDSQDEAERMSVATYVKHLPNPFPMQKEALEPLEGTVWAYRHLEGEGANAGQVWILWAENAGAPAVVEVPIRHSQALLVDVTGVEQTVTATNGTIRVSLSSDEMSPPRMVVDRP